MADSVYISKNLDQNQLQFMKLLQDHEILYFDMRDIEQQIHQHFDNLNEVLENLTDKGLLYRIERGKYALNNYHNMHVLATFICSDSCVSYWTALHYHGLTERFPNTEFIKTTHRKRPTSIKGTPIKYVSVKPSKLIGIMTQGFGDDRFEITDHEMTLVDCFDQPRYAGDFADLIAAFARAELTGNKLIKYTEAYQNITLIKRMGYLASLFHLATLSDFIEYAQTKVNARYSLVDARGNDEGEFIKEWGLRLNVSQDNILRMANQEY